MSPPALCGRLQQPIAYLDVVVGIRAIEVGADFVHKLLRDRRAPFSIR
jgi:hypothetical protein